MTTRTRLSVALVLAAAVAVLEFWGGSKAHSLALTTDAVHVCMDVFALSLALLAAINANRPADRRRTFGYGRIEILAALANGTILLVATVVIVYQALQRFSAPVASHGIVMTLVAAIGLVVNVAIGLLLSHRPDENLNVRAALFHVVGDALGAFAVIVGGVAIAVTGYTWIDPALSLFVASVIVIGVWRVMRDATDVLLEAAPRNVDADEVEAEIAALDGVVAVHDLHVWSIGSGPAALSAHILLDDRRLSEASAVLGALCDLVKRRYGITHVTVQFECEHCDPQGARICIPTPTDTRTGAV